NIPEEERVGGHGMNVEMTLFNELPGIDFSVLDKPIGKAKFDPANNEVTWDLEYTNGIRNEIARLMKEWEDKQKRAANADEEFAKLMSQGDAAMGAADFAKAVESFTGALGIKPNEPVATAKLSDAKMRLDEQLNNKKRDEDYAALIKEADNLFGKKSYEEAVGKYRAATQVKESEAYPKDKIKEIETLLAELAKKEEEERKARELQEKYDAAVKAGDAAFKAEKYEEARTSFTEATGLKPEEAYPKEKLTAIAAALEALAKKAEEERLQRELDAKYQAAITAADAAFNAGNYDAAKPKYSEAFTLKPDEKYPKERLAEIEKRLEELARKAEEERKARELQEAYDAAIRKGDDGFTAKDFDAARAGYNEALGLKPDEKYPKEGLQAIDAALEEMARKAEEERLRKELEEKYKGLLAKADAAFNAEDFEEARNGYNEALGIKPEEKYPKDRLKAIDERLAEIARLEEEERQRKELEERYTAALKVADDLFNGSAYEEAKVKYGDASAIKPDERYPKDRMVEINAILAELARKAEEERKRLELEARYNELITSADQAFEKEEFSAALNDYKDALQLKPQETHPKERIAAIEAKLDAAAREAAEKERLEREARERDQRYAELIAKADQAFQGQDLQQARSFYSDASSVKPEERYPKDRMAEIDGLLADRAAADEAARLAAEAEAAEKARLEAERRRAANEAAAADKEYRELLAAADLAFDQDAFDQAREGYTQALAMRPEDPYPKERLNAIEAELARRQQAMADAERLAAERRSAEEERLRREAADRDAKLREDEAERRRLEELKALEERYRVIIADADLAFTEEAYMESRGLYAQALDIKPEESYPASRIEQIDKLLEELERKRKAEELASKPKEEPPPPPKKTSTTIDIRKEQEAEQFMRDARLREEAEKYERIKKLKRDVSEQEVEFAESSGERRGQALDNKQRLKEADASLYQGSEAMRLRNAAELEAYRRSLQQLEAERQERASQTRDAAANEVNDAQQELADQRQQMDARHEARVRGSLKEQEAVREKLAEDMRHGRDRNDQAREEVLAMADAQRAMQERGSQLAEENRSRIADAKELNSKRESLLMEKAADQRLSERERLQDTPLNKQKDFADYNRSKLAQEYPPGVTEESYTEGNKVIIRRVVVSGNKADEYSKVIAKWGTFYFRNGQSISETIWTSETEGE
ncbi:MAG: hypothetical protein KDB88_08470, partial [Flavobacteriales bacterium]|nr:hypothetical protein [Flavobacteriales bacterium]